MVIEFLLLFVGFSLILISILGLFNMHKDLLPFLHMKCAETYGQPSNMKWFILYILEIMLSAGILTPFLRISGTHRIMYKAYLVLVTLDVFYNLGFFYISVEYGISSRTPYKDLFFNKSLMIYRDKIYNKTVNMLHPHDKRWDFKKPIQLPFPTGKLNKPIETDFERAFEGMETDEYSIAYKDILAELGAKFYTLILSSGVNVVTKELESYDDNLPNYSIIPAYVGFYVLNSQIYIISPMNNDTDDFEIIIPEVIEAANSFGLTNSRKLRFVSPKGSKVICLTGKDTK